MTDEPIRMKITACAPLLNALVLQGNLLLQLLRTCSPLHQPPQVLGRKDGLSSLQSLKLTSSIERSRSSRVVAPVIECTLSQLSVGTQEVHSIGIKQTNLCLDDFRGRSNGWKVDCMLRTLAGGC